MSANGANTETNATLIQVSIGPNSCSTWPAASSTCAWSATSTASASAFPPASSTSRTAPSRPASPRAISPTLAPRSPYSRATARPMPPLAPVITTVSVMSPVLSLREIAGSGSLLLPGNGQPRRALEHERVHEGLRQVPPPLPLGHVVFLRVQAGGTARGPVALEPAGRVQLPALLLQGEGHHEAAQQEGALGVAERPLVVPEPVGVTVLGELVGIGAQRFHRARVVGRQRPADRRQQQRRIDRGVVRGALPAPGGVHRLRAGPGEDHVGEAGPVRGLRLGAAGPGGGAQPGHGGEPAVRPGLVAELPDPGVVLLPPFRDRAGAALRGPPALGVQPVLTGCGREQQRRFA